MHKSVMRNVVSWPEHYKYTHDNDQGGKLLKAAWAPSVTGSRDGYEINWLLARNRGKESER